MMPTRCHLSRQMLPISDYMFLSVVYQEEYKEVYFVYMYVYVESEMPRIGYMYASCICIVCHTVNHSLLRLYYNQCTKTPYKL